MPRAPMRVAFILALTFLFGNAIQVQTDQDVALLNLRLTLSSLNSQVSASSQSANSSGGRQTEAYECVTPPCQRVLFNLAMKRIVANPNDAVAYFSLARSMCPKINSIIIGRPLTDGRLECPEGVAQALNQYLVLAPNSQMAAVAKNCLAALGKSESSPPEGARRGASAAPQPSSTTNNAGRMPATQDPRGRQIPSGMLDGVYVGIRKQTFSTQLNDPVDYNFLIFSPEGLALGHFPQEGLDGSNLAGLIRNQPGYAQVGQYRTNGAQIEIQWQRPTPDRWLINYDDKGADPWRNYIPICRCNGARFSGTYQYSRYALQFLPDGKFLDYGAVDAFLTGGAVYPRQGRGAYRIQNFTLYLSYDDGRQFRKSFAAPAVQEGQPSFDWMLIGTSLLYEQNYYQRMRNQMKVPSLPSYQR